MKQRRGELSPFLKFKLTRLFQCGLYRFSTFKRNLDFVDYHNKKFGAGLVAFKVSINNFSHWVNNKNIHLK